MAKQEIEKDLIVRMITAFRQWYMERFSVPVQYSSRNAYIVEYNTMKGLRNMLEGTYRYKNPTVIPGDNIILGMWQRLLDYLKEKNTYCYASLLSIHRNYNTIAAMLMRHQQKQKIAENKKLGDKQQQKLDFLNQMLNGNKQ
ncbi:MAG: hypothetical protein VZQ51_07520 [Bacteroidales bacterium]|nr:hypothetical protein [Bacteroidales bacterium]